MSRRKRKQRREAKNSLSTRDSALLRFSRHGIAHPDIKKGNFILGQFGTGKTGLLIVADALDGSLPTVPHPAPPRFAEFCLLLVPLRQRKDILGDLQEEFRTVVVPNHGISRARFYYVWQVIMEVFWAIANLATRKRD
jgi:hypothetical protein